MTNTNNITIENITDTSLNNLSAGGWIQWVIIVMILSFQIFTLIRGIKEQSRKYGDILNSMGIFGTFLGICIGLWYLNPENITESIPGFIGSMKIAFITSVSGLLGSLILNYCLKDEVKEEIDLSDIINVLKTGNNELLKKIDSLVDLNAYMSDTIFKLAKSIGGNEEGSLLNQTILLRSNMNDKFNSLNEEFRKFAQFQAENNTKALVEAIREVIGDFNAKINEQFGENFKELNHAVGDLVSWQDNYKDVVESTYQKITLASDSIEISKGMLEKVQERFNENMVINNEVKVILDVISEQSSLLDDKMKAFSELSITAQDAFPTIKNNIEALTDGFSKEVDVTMKTVHNNLQNQQNMTSDLMENIRNNVTKSLESMDAAVEKTNTAITHSIDNMENSVDEVAKHLSKNMENSFSDALHNIEQLQQSIGSAFESTMMQMSDAQRQEMERSLQSLGNELASLSQKFVDDYAELTSRMRTIVTMAEG